MIGGLGIGIWLGGSQAPVGGAAWTPTTVIANLAWWAEPKPANLTKLGGGTPVDGDQVSAITDLSGNSVSLTQVTTGAYPIYHTDGTYFWLTFNGSSMFLLSASGQTLTDGSGQHSAAAAVKFANNTGIQAALDADSATRISQLLRNNAGTAETIAFSSGGTPFTDAGPTITAASSTVLIEKTSTSATEIFVNGTGNGATSVTPPLQSGTGYIAIGYNISGPGNYLNGNWYGGFLYKGVMGSTDLAGAQTYMRALMP